MDYSKELVFHLRLRHLDEVQIADIVAEVDSHRASGGDPEEFFGAPAAYAARFPSGPRRARESVATYVGAGVAVTWLVVVALLVATTEFEPPVATGAFLLWPAIGAMLVGLVVSFLTARYRPVMR